MILFVLSIVVKVLNRKCA